VEMERREEKGRWIIERERGDGKEIGKERWIEKEERRDRQERRKGEMDRSEGKRR
jgi:hypothetical protein